MPSAQYEMSFAKKGPYHIPWNEFPDSSEN